MNTARQALMNISKFMLGLRLIMAVDNWRDYLYLIRLTQGFKPRDDFVRMRGGPSIRIRRMNLADRYAVVEVYVKRLYSFPGFEIGRGDTIIDIGAHIGTFTVLAASRAAEGRVISFEPVSGNFSLLEENVRLNRLANVHAQRMGVAGERGEYDISVSGADSTGCTICRKGDGSERIRCITLEDVFSENGVERCDFLKIDCEGAEYQILMGAPDHVFGRIRRIALECHDHLSQGPGHARLRQFLEGKGFTVAIRYPMMYAWKKVPG